MKELICPDCGGVFILHGLCQRCPECSKKHTREQAKVKQKLWREQNDKHVRAYQKCYRESYRRDYGEALKEANREYYRWYYHENKEHICAQRRARRAAKKEENYGC